MSDPMHDPKRLIDLLEDARRPGTVASPQQREENLRRLIRAAVPSAEVSEALRERVRALEVVPMVPARSAVWPTFPGGRLGWALVAALVLGGIVTPIVRPTWVAARALQRVGAAITDARSAHDVTWSISRRGGPKKISETWYQNGQWRTQDFESGSIQIFTDGKLWSYEPKADTVTIRRAEGPSGYNPSGFSLAAIARDIARWGWHDRVRVIGRRSWNGRPVFQVVIERAGESRRGLMWVDAGTNLPVRSESQQRVDPKTGLPLRDGSPPARDELWITDRVTGHHYNQQIPARLFVPSFPRAARVVDWDAGRRYWEQRFAKGIAQQRVGDRTIVIRDFQVCSEGDIFVLYTAGRRPGPDRPDWSQELRDDQGGKYQNGGLFQPYMEGNRAPAGPGYVFDGQKLEGYWWVPSAPERFSLPRRFRVIFHIPSVLPRGPAPRGPVQEKDLTRLVTFDLPVQRAKRTVLPRYMPFMAFGPDEWEVHRARVWARAERSLMAHNLPQALAEYRKLVKLSQAHAQAAGGSLHDAQLRLAIGNVLQRMGRLREARATFQQAVRDAVSPDSSRQEAQEAVQAVERELAWSPGRQAPAVTGTDLEGRRVSTERYRGQVLLIDLWSRWSHDSPDLKALYRRYHGRGLAILGVALDVDEGALRRFVREQDLAWPQLFDRYGWRSKIAGRFGYRHEVTSLPRTILVDPHGAVRAVDLHGAALRKAVAHLMDGEVQAMRSGRS